MKVHLVDGTYELFRYHFALPSHITAAGREVAATRGALGTVLQLLEEGATHVGVATDHVIESFRNDLWPGYKTSAGMPPDLLAQFPLLEEGAGRAAASAVFAMVEFEADDAMAAAAAIAAADDPRSSRCSSARRTRTSASACVGDRVVQLDRRKGVVFDDAGVREKFGVDARVDPRLPRPGGRQRRRLPGPARLGGQVGRRRARPLRAPRGHPARRRRLGRRTCGAARSWP